MLCAEMVAAPSTRLLLLSRFQRHWSGISLFTNRPPNTLLIDLHQISVQSSFDVNSLSVYCIANVQVKRGGCAVLAHCINSNVCHLYSTAAHILSVHIPNIEKVEYQAAVSKLLRCIGTMEIWYLPLATCYSFSTNTSSIYRQFGVDGI